MFRRPEMIIHPFRAYPLPFPNESVESPSKLFNVASFTIEQAPGIISLFGRDDQLSRLN
jgi:hypothetical protein